MEEWLINIINEYGYLSIVCLIAIENIFPPIPSEVILTFGGFMTTTSNLSIAGVVISATAGSVIGAVVLYTIGILLGIERLEKVIDRWGHILRFKIEDIHRAYMWFDKYGLWTVFFCRFIPLIRSLISIPAGIINMNLGIFLLLTTLGSFIWNIALVWLGASVGGSWDKIVGYMDIYSNAVYALLFLMVIVLFIFLKRRK